MPDKAAFTIKIGEGQAGARLDVAIAEYLPDCSRNLGANLVRTGVVLVDGRIKKPGYRIKAGETITGDIPAPETPRFGPQPVPVHILYEDDHLIVVDKPAGLVVHPGPGHPSATLVNALLFHCPDIEGIGGEARPGIVHRLDKDTSGVMVVAKNSPAHENLGFQFKSRKIKKNYLALAWGNVSPSSGRIDFAIGRHPTERKRMSVHSPKGRRAETHWKVLGQYAWCALLELDLKTGRTHQIRVHLSAMGHPVLGDLVYDKKKRLLLSGPNDSSIAIPRQMLHAHRIGFKHPSDGRWMQFEAPVPKDMRSIMEITRNSIIEIE